MEQLMVTVMVTMEMALEILHASIWVNLAKTMTNVVPRLNAM
jgi:hypothetical protein